MGTAIMWLIILWIAGAVFGLGFAAISTLLSKD